MTRDPAVALQLGTELARRAQFYVMGKELVVSRIGVALDDDVIRLQHEPGHHAIFAASTEQAYKSSNDCHK